MSSHAPSLKDIFFQPTIKILVFFILCLLLLQASSWWYFSLLIRMELAEPGMQILETIIKDITCGLLLPFYDILCDYASNGYVLKLFCSST